jgi:branched-subunit amino acid ABC-type transport system permease component
MSLSVLLLAFAVVIVVGIGALPGAFFCAFPLSMIMAVTAAICRT